MSGGKLNRCVFWAAKALAWILRRAFLRFESFTRWISNNKSPSRSNRILSAILLIFAVSIAIIVPAPIISGSWQIWRFNRLSPADHLEQAKAACGNGGKCANMSEAWRHLQKIPASAPEHGEALKLQAAMEQQEMREQDEAQKLRTADEEQEMREKDEAKQRSREQMQRNFQGEAHDRFICATSTEHQPIVSFDDGQFWWEDDGRCAARQQKHRDEAAQASSYWSTILRVDTDMDSFWLPDEERTCQTFPDEKGRVATVTCDSKARAIHNIPVKFWGGVDRNTVSDWKCRREKDIFSDQFVCRAID
jgi:hypothetical protein